MKFFHTMQKLKAHLHCAESCRTTLQGLNMHCPVAPGSGSQEDADRATTHDRLLPPLQCEGPRLPPVRGRTRPDIDGELYDTITDQIIEAVSAHELLETLREVLVDRPISWTRLRRTLNFIEDTLADEDTEILNIDIKSIKAVLHKLGDPGNWPSCAPVL